MIRLVIADDQAVVRAGLSVILGAEEDIDVVGEAADGAEAVKLARSLQPDVVCMDIRMPGVDGIEATRAIVSDPDVDADVLIRHRRRRPGLAGGRCCRFPPQGRR